MKRNPYDPQIPPERVLAENIVALKEEIGGIDRIIRFGANYFMSCHCGEFRVSTEGLDVSKFLERHQENCNE